MRLPLVLLLPLAALPVAARGGEPAPAPASCSAAGVEAIVSLEYAERLVGGVSGTFVLVGYDRSLAVPGRGSDASVRERVQSLAGADTRLVPSDEDGDGDGREDRLRLLLTTGTGGLEPGPVGRVRFDCPSGGSVPVTALTCVTQQVADAAGQQMHPEQARMVTCSARLAMTSSVVPTPATNGP